MSSHAARAPLDLADREAAEHRREQAGALPRRAGGRRVLVFAERAQRDAVRPERLHHHADRSIVGDAPAVGDEGLHQERGERAPDDEPAAILLEVEAERAGGDERAY